MLPRWMLSTTWQQRTWLVSFEIPGCRSPPPDTDATKEDIRRHHAPPTTRRMPTGPHLLDAQPRYASDCSKPSSCFSEAV